MATKKKAVKKPLHPAIRAIRKVLVPWACGKWQAKLRKARTLAAMRQLWDEAEYEDRHFALVEISPKRSSCIACEMGRPKVMGMPFKDVLPLIRKRAKELPR